MIIFPKKCAKSQISEFYLVRKTAKKVAVFCLHQLKKLTTSSGDERKKQGSSGDLKAFLKLKSRKKSGSNWKTSQQSEELKCFPFSFIAMRTTNQQKIFAKKRKECLCFPVFGHGDKGDSGAWWYNFHLAEENVYIDLLQRQNEILS